MTAGELRHVFRAGGMADGSPLRQYQARHDIRHVRSGGFDPDHDDGTCAQIGRDPNSSKRAGRSPSASALQGATGLASVMPLIIGAVAE